MKLEQLVLQYIGYRKTLGEKFKTNESYFILKFLVNPSEKFKNIFEKIIKSEPVGLITPHFNSLLGIIKTRRFISFETFVMSLKCRNLDDLLVDLNYQIKKTLTKHFKGYFHDSKKNYMLPCIEYFEVGNMIDFHQDEDLNFNFDGGSEGYYCSNDKEIEIYPSNRNKKDQTLIKVVKQKAENKAYNTDDHPIEWNNIESSYLIKSLSFPCVFQGILKEQFRKLNLLKRNIYDFVSDSNKSKFIKSLLLFYYNSRYVKLKKELTQILLTTKRFENEFTKDKIYLYTSEYDLRKFNHQNLNNSSDDKNLLNFITEKLNYQVKDLDKKTQSINEIFKIIEELNIYRTNYILQITSLFVAILAFIFAFDKAKEFILKVYEYILHML